MKLVIQIPCLNEREQLAGTLAGLPTAADLEGVDEVLVLVIDDGSSDGTADLARELGVDEVIRLPRHRGLARAFSAGLDAAVGLGGDVIVNTDADNQYPGSEIARLVGPILRGEADIVVGDRQVGTIAHFTPQKRALQRLGSWVVRLASGTAIPDATSGFRAFNREAAQRLVVTSEFSYTLETLIQAGHAGLVVVSVPVATNPPTRESRLFQSIPEYLWSSGITIVRSYALHQPLRLFLGVSAVLGGSGLLLGLRFLWFFYSAGGAGHVQSLVLTAILIVTGFLALIFGVLADMVGTNRRMLEAALTRLKRLEAERGRR